MSTNNPLSVSMASIASGVAGRAGAATIGRAVRGSMGRLQNVAPCAFQLDVQWILDAIDKVQTIIEKVRSFTVNILDQAEKILQKLSGILSWFCWMPLGKFAKTVVDNACRVIRGAVNTIAKIYDRVAEAMKHVLAPWEVRSAGAEIRDKLAPKCAEFADAVHKGNLKSVTTWTGAASELFQSSIDRQHQTANDAADGAREFGETVNKIGADGVTTTVTFITALISAIGGIIAAIIKMAAVPVGTPIGAALIMGLVGAIFTYIMVYVNAMLGIIKQSSELNNAASRVSGAEWPKARIA